MNLASVLRHDARHFPGKVGLRIDGTASTFAELEGRVDEVVAVLGSHVAPGDRVGLWLHNTVSWYATFIAINALGAIAVPVNTRLTAAECLAILRDARIRVLVTTRRYRGRDYLEEALAAARPDYDEFVAFAAADDVRASEWPFVAVGVAAAGIPIPSFDDSLCIQYTSGTTATPKGVMLTNRAYLLTASYVARCQQLTPSSNFISAGPFFHCSGTMHAITVCLVAGCTLNSLSAWDPEWFVEETARQRCDVAHMVYFRDVLSLGGQHARSKLATLRVAHDLGTRAYLSRLHEELGLSGISNLYGMTETAGQYTMWFPDDPLDKRLSTNGRPQPGNLLRIGDPESGAALPPGAIGEIQMKGRTVSPGYFNRPEANASAFTHDGWLRSGDLGTINEEGELHYVARLKELIRVGGENMAPAEVEQAMRDAFGVEQVCVLGVPDARLDEVPAAVVVGAAGVDWPSAIAALRRTVAGFKIPRAVYSADQFPLTATNRVQRAVLREWIAAGKLTRLM